MRRQTAAGIAYRRRHARALLTGPTPRRRNAPELRDDSWMRSPEVVRIISGIKTPTEAGFSSCPRQRSENKAWRRAPSRYAAASQSRSEEHTSELQSLMRNSYAVFCLKKKKKTLCINDMSTTPHYTLMQRQTIRKTTRYNNSNLLMT